MNCYFCQQPTVVVTDSSVTKCANHPYTIYHYKDYNVWLDSHIYFESNKSSYKSVFAFYVYINTDIMQLVYHPLGNDPKTIYHGILPKNFSPENSIDFAHRILNMKAFL